MVQVLSRHSLCAGSVQSKQICFGRPNVWLRWLLLAALILTGLQRTMTAVHGASAKCWELRLQSCVLGCKLSAPLSLSLLQLWLPEQLSKDECCNNGRMKQVSNWEAFTIHDCRWWHQWTMGSQPCKNYCYLPAAGQKPPMNTDTSC